MIDALRDPDAARDWMAAGLSLARTAGAHPAQDAARWLRALAELRADLPPPGFVVDLGRLLTQERSSRLADPGPAWLRSYEDQVLGRVAVDPLREAVSDAIRALPTGLRAIAVALCVDAVLGRIGFTDGNEVDPGALRDLDAWPEAQWAARATVAQRGAAGSRLERQIHALVDQFQRAARALDPADVAVIERLPALPSAGDRLALRQVIDASEALCAGLPRRMRSTGRRGHVSTNLDDESAYPVGGFSAISTRGSPENLLPSELAGMEDDDGPDLFDVRWAEGELLHYTRDESQFVRTRRRIAIALSADLAGARFREEGLPWQRAVIALGMVHAIVARLAEWLGDEDLQIHVSIASPALDDEARALFAALAPWLARGVVVRQPFEPAVAARADRLTVGLEPVPIAAAGVEVALTATHPPALRVDGQSHALPDTPWEAWRVALAQTLAVLV